MTPCRRRGTWVSVLEPALPGNRTHLHFMMLACLRSCLYLMLVLYEQQIYMELQVIMARANGFLEVFRWMIIWIGFGCAVVFSWSSLKVLLLSLCIGFQSALIKMLQEEKDGRKQMRNEGQLNPSQIHCVFSAVSLHILLFTGNKHWDFSSLETVHTTQIQLTMCHSS